MRMAWYSPFVPVKEGKLRWNCDWLVMVSLQAIKKVVRT